MTRHAAFVTLFISLVLPLHATDSEDLAAARALFEKNLASIVAKDKDAYLSTYLQSSRLARTGPPASASGSTISRHRPAPAGPTRSRVAISASCR